MPVLVRPLYQDPFAPMLRTSEVLAVSEEQKMYIREVLSIGASDEQFADKMYKAITRILTGGSVKAPLVSALTPGSATIGDPSFDIHVHGSNFTPESKIIFNGFEEPTTFVSAGELTTGVDMSVWLAAATVPVAVQNGDGVISNAQSFVFQDVAAMSTQKAPALKESLKPVVTLPHASVPPVKK